MSDHLFVGQVYNPFNGKYERSCMKCHDTAIHSLTFITTADHFMIETVSTKFFCEGKVSLMKYFGTAQGP